MKIKNLLVGAIAAVVLVACGGVENTPESVAKAYMEKVKQMDFEGAKAHADESTGKILDMMKSMEGMMPEEEKEKAKKSEITKVECEEPKEDKTKCTCTIKDAEGEESTETVDMKKVDGNWKVHMEKDM